MSTMKKKIILVTIGILFAGCSPQKPISQYEEGFNAGVRYAIFKFEANELLLTPESVPDGTTFKSCIFVKFIHDAPVLKMGAVTDATISDCVFYSYPMETVSWPLFSQPIEDQFFEKWNTMNEPDKPSALLIEEPGDE